MPKRPPRTDAENSWRKGFGGRIRRVREEELNLSQLELAVKLGFGTSAWLSDIERGVNGMDVFPFWEFCKLAGYPPEYFLDPNFSSDTPTLPRTRIEWDRMFRGQTARAAAHWEIDQAFRRMDLPI